MNKINSARAAFLSVMGSAFDVLALRFDSLSEGERVTREVLVGLTSGRGITTNEQGETVETVNPLDITREAIRAYHSGVSTLTVIRAGRDAGVYRGTPLPKAELTVEEKKAAAKLGREKAAAKDAAASAAAVNSARLDAARSMVVALAATKQSSDQIRAILASAGMPVPSDFAELFSPGASQAAAPPASEASKPKSKSK